MNYANGIKTTGIAALPPWRSRLLFFVLLLGLGGLIARSVYLQCIHHNFLEQKGAARYGRVVDINAHRGMITDRHGEPLAISTPVDSIWISPQDVEATPQQVKQLAKIVGMDASEVKSKLFDTSHDFVYLKRLLSPEQAEKAVKLEIPGVSSRREYRRYYPSEDMTAHLLGFTDVDDKGQEGLELEFQEKLSGKAGSERVIKDRRGYTVEDVASISAPKPGLDMALSLDSKMQYMAFREIKQAVALHNAKSGSIVVLDAKSGEVLALANWPSYNPNNRGKVDLKAMRNHAVTDLYEPGSVMKPFTISTALDAGKIKPRSVINTENGVYVIGGRKIHDTHPEPSLSISRIIQLSSNVGAAKIALTMSPKTFWHGLSEVGFGSLTGSAFGNGISVNLLQMARAYTVFANDGELKTITLLRQDTPVEGKKVFTPATVHAVRDMMELVVQPGGTAPGAQINGYRVAGKTGTAHKVENGHYVNKYIASFVGLAPASNPRLIVAVMVDEPSGAHHYGGDVSAPVFSNVMGAALRLLNIPNDAPLGNVLMPSTDIIKEDA